VTSKPNALVAGLEFQLASQNTIPAFKIAAEPFQFRIAGESPRFVITPTPSRFVLVYN